MNLIMMWYNYLAYFIYKFYRKRDNLPVFFSFLVTTMLVSVNIESFAGAVHLLYPYLNYDSKYYALILIFIIALGNYFVLYRNKRYEIIFDNFDKNSEEYDKWKFSVKLYIVLTITFLLFTLVIADLKNHGKL